MAPKAGFKVQGFKVSEFQRFVTGAARPAFAGFFETLKL
jgi:hypothetical protein